MPTALGSGSGATGSPAELVAWAFDQAWAVAQDKADTSDAMFDKALSAGGTAPSATAAGFNFTPNVIEPLVNIPQQAEGASVAKFYELSNAVISQLAGLFRDYMGQYFPDDQPYLQDTESWLVKALTVGGTGMNQSIEAQIWERDRARILKDADRQEGEALASWAAKRYPLPPGAAAYQVMRIRQDAADKIAQASRDVAIKQAEMEIQNVRFAVENAIKLYASAMSAATDYVKALSVGPASGMQIVPSVTDSQARLISSAADYYRARISVEELKMKASLTPAEWEQQTRLKNADWIMEEIKTKVQAAIAAAQSMGTQAASALNALHAQAGVQGSSSTQVGYSYGGDVTSDVPPITSI